MMPLAEIDAALKDALQDVDREIARIEIALAYLREQHDRLCGKRDSVSAALQGAE